MLSKKDKPEKAEETKEAPKTSTELLGAEYKFKVYTAPGDAEVDLIDFEDGRKYKFQHPSFMKTHEVLMEATEHELFAFALTCLHPNGTDSPEINEQYLNTHHKDGFYLWSPLVRGLLQKN